MEWTRVALIVVTLGGMAMCSAGISKVTQSGQWLSLPGIVGSLLGVALLAVVGAQLLGRPLPLVTSDLIASGVVAAFIVGKVAIAAASGLA